MLLYLYILLFLYSILKLNFKELTFMEYIKNYGWIVCLNSWSFFPPPALFKSQRMEFWFYILYFGLIYTEKV